MLQILKTEWLKIKTYPAFWWVIGITALAYPGISYMMLSLYNKLLTNPQLPGNAARMLLGDPFSLNEVWHTVAYFSSFFVFFPAIVVIMLITNEYSFKTYRQNIIDGWSRKQFLTAKLLDVVIISVLITLLYIIVCLLMNTGNVAETDRPEENRAYFISYFLLQTFSQLSIAFVIGFLLRKSFSALSIFIFLFLILEPFLVSVLSSRKIGAAAFLPFEISDRMVPSPGFIGKMDPTAYGLAMSNTGHHFVYTIVFTIILWIFCYWLNNRRDI